MPGSTVASEPIITTEAKPRASPPMAAVAAPEVSHLSDSADHRPKGRVGPAARAASESVTTESITRQRPPKSSTCTTGSPNADLLVYCSGRVSASTRAAAGAHCGPARPPKVSTANAPRTGLTSTAPAIPCVQKPAERITGKPARTWGTSPAGCGENPVLEKVSPGWAPPNL